MSSFSLRLLVFFSVKRLQFSFGTFSNVQQDNALAFKVTYTLIFVNVTASFKYTSFTFSKLFIFFLLKVNWGGGDDSFTNSLRRNNAEFLNRLSSNAYEFDEREMPFH